MRFISVLQSFFLLRAFFFFFFCSLACRHVPGARYSRYDATLKRCVMLAERCYTLLID